MERKYHTVNLTFSNDKKICLAIPELFSREELESGVNLKNIAISEAKKLPKNYSFTEIQENTDQ